MEKAHIQKIRKVLGDKLSITGDNMLLFTEKVKHQHVIWDDNNELLYSVRLQMNNYIKDQQPYTIVATSYENIQYLSTSATLEHLNTILTKLKAEGLNINVEDICNDMADAVRLEIS